MKKTYRLVQPARKKGGDKYESSDGHTIYVEQNISRPNGTPAKTITVTYEIGGEDA